MKNRIWKRFLFSIVLIGCEWSALAQLQMVIDTENKEFFFRGSDSGLSSFFSANTYNIFFFTGNLGNTIDRINSYFNLIMVTPSGYIPDYGLSPISVQFSNQGSFQVIFRVNHEMVTLTGTEIVQSYNDFRYPIAIDAFESLIGSSMNLLAGSGFMPLEVVGLTPALSISNSTTYVDITFEGALEMSDDITDTNSWSTISSNSPYRVQKNMISDPAYYRAVE